MLAGLKNGGLASVGKQQLPGRREGKAGNVDDLPRVAVRIGKIARIAAPAGFLRGLEEARSGGQRAHEGGIDLGARGAIPRQGGAAEPGRDGAWIERRIPGELIPAK